MKQKIFWLFVILGFFLFAIPAYADLLDHLRSVIDFAETSGNFTDKVGTYNSTADNSIVSKNVAGINGNAWNFSTSYVNFPSAWLADRRNFTINIWLRQHSLLNSVVPLSCDEGGGAFSNFIYYRDVDKPLVRLKDAAGAGQFVTLDGPATNSVRTWYMFTITSNGDKLVTFYMNGTSINSGSFGATMNGIIVTGGCVLGNRASGSYWNGMIDELYLWNRSLSSSEVSSLWNSGIGLFYPFGGVDSFPYYSNFQNNATTNAFYNGRINFSIRLFDDVKVSGYKFASNISGTLVNNTWTFLNLSSSNVSTILNITTRAPAYICGQYWLNDTANQQNLTNLSCFYVYPQVDFLSPENGSLVQVNPVSYNFTFDFNATSCYLYTNLTGNFSAVANVTAGSYNTTELVGMTENLSAYYRFEEGSGSIADDSSSLGNNGTINNGALYQASKSGNATGDYSLNFNGANQYVNVTAIGDYERTQAFSISFWFKSTTTPVTYAVMVGKYDAGATRGYMVYIDNIPRLSFIIANSAANYLHVTAPIGASLDGNWHHISSNYDGSSSASGMRIYLDNVNQTLTIQKNNLAATVLTSETFRMARDSSGNYFTGNLDEIQLINKTINSSHVGNLYNYGVTSFNSVTTEHNTTLTADNVTSLNYTFTNLSIKRLRSFIYCFDSNIFKNSTFHDYIFAGDTIPPVINVTFPYPNNQTLNTDINITMTTDEETTCALNNSNFSNIYIDAYNWKFIETTLNNSFYSIVANCTDLSGNSATANITFIKDKAYPEIIVTSPLNNSVWDSTIGILYLNYTFLDNRDLYYKNITIYHYNVFLDRLDQYNDFSYISGNEYNFFDIIDFSNITNGTNFIDIKVCDSHTAKEIKKADYVKEDKDSLSFQFDDVTIKLKGKTGKEKSMKAKKEKDRYSFKVDYAQAVEKKIFELSSNQDIVPIPYDRSGYLGHFVIADKYWIDFETASKNAVSISQNNDSTWSIEIDGLSDSLELNSIGELNCLQITTTFTKLGEVASYPFNLGFDISSVGGMIFLFTLIILYLGLMFLGFTFNNMGFVGFGFLVGIVLGLILAQFHIFLMLLFTLTNIGIIISFARKQR